VMHQAGAGCRAIDAGRCLLLEPDEIFRAADQLAISIVAAKE
jgi:DUF1009 family protein